MLTSLSPESIDRFSDEVRAVTAHLDNIYPGESGRRQPVHSVYGGAQLFRSDTISKLGRMAMRSFKTYARDASSFGELLGIPNELRESIFERILEKLEREAIEDYRIDFEDGFGVRADDDEDDHAVTAAVETAKAITDGTLSPFFGIRIKPLTAEFSGRSLRTLDLYLTALLGETGCKLPNNFVVTLPKVLVPEQIAILGAALAELESKLNLTTVSIKIEVMIETTQAIVGPDGNSAMLSIVNAGQGRCRGAHFGAYDYTAACGITSAHQDILHQACDFARNMMQVSLAGTGVWLSDGATNIMPVGPHRGDLLTDDQAAENAEVVHRGWKLHYDHCRHSLANGFYQGWDLHPAQIPTRYAAVYTFFLEGLSAASERLQNFLDAAARATMIGDVFDDAATVQGLLNYFLRAINCGAMTEDEATQITGISLEEIRGASFANILKNRQS